MHASVLGRQDPATTSRFIDRKGIMWISRKRYNAIRQEICKLQSWVKDMSEIIDKKADKREASLTYGPCHSQKIPINSAVWLILAHLGLKVEEVPATDKTVRLVQETRKDRV